MATTGPSKTSRKQREICVKEEFKIAVKIALDRFRFEETQKGRVLCLWVVAKYRIRNYMLFMFFSLLAKNNLSSLFVSVAIVVVDFKREISCYLNSFILIQEEFLYYSCIHFMLHYSI